MRLDAYLARAGLASRRESRMLIRRGAVWVDGEICRDAARRIHGEEVVVGDGVQPVRLGASNGAELMQHHLKITVAIATRSCGRFGVDLRPVGFWSLKGHSESRAEVIKILVDEVADDLEYGPV